MRINKQLFNILSIGLFILLSIALSSCDRVGVQDQTPPCPIRLSIINQTPEKINSENIYVQARNVETKEYYSFNRYVEGNKLSLTIGSLMSATPQESVLDPGAWFGVESKSVVDLLLYDEAKKPLGTIRVKWETTKRNANRITEMVSYTGFSFVELEPMKSATHERTFDIKFL